MTTAPHGRQAPMVGRAGVGSSRPLSGLELAADRRDVEPGEVAFAREGAIQAKNIIGTVEVLGAGVHAPHGHRAGPCDYRPVDHARRQRDRRRDRQPDGQPSDNGLSSLWRPSAARPCDSTRLGWSGRLCFAGACRCGEFPVRRNARVAVWFNVPQEEFLFFGTSTASTCCAS